MEPASTPDTSSALQQLVGRYLDFPDFRIDTTNKTHLLVDVLVSATCAVIGGANSWLAVERFVLAHEVWFRSFLGLPQGVPSHDTYRRIFLLLDTRELNRRFATWVGDISQRLALKQVAIDGKTLCGSGGGHTGLPALHLVHAFATENGICLGQQAADSKSNEITAIPELLKLLDLKGAVVTIDAMGCQKNIAADIVKAGADYVLAVKGNQGHLHEDVRQTLEPLIAAGTSGAEPHARTEEMNRGRREKRTCIVSTDLTGIREASLWEGLTTLGVVISEREVNGKREVERRYFISSRVMSAAEMMGCVRDHWKVENQLHWVMDVVFGEDGHQLRSGNGPENFSTLRKLAHALIKNSQPKHGIKGTRELAGWNLNFLEEIIRKAAVSPAKTSA